MPSWMGPVSPYHGVFAGFRCKVCWMQPMWSNSVTWRLGRERMAPHSKYSALYKTVYRTLELDGFFGSRIKIWSSGKLLWTWKQSFHIILSVHCEWLQSLRSNKCTYSTNIRGPTQKKRDYKKNETNLIVRKPRVGGEKQTDGYRTCSDLSQCYKAQLDRFTHYKWTHLQI
jgi:hypothetical protein